jgi:cytochrome oxidase Cu insertion factor (SCO1/SenC/PrrC family)
MRRRRLGALAAALLVSAAPAASGHQPAPAASAGGRLTAEPSLAVIRPAPDFALADVTGADVRLSELRGKIVLLSFIYTSCSAACPLLTQRMAVLQGRLTEAKLFPGDVTLLSVTVDPERDSAAVLARYAQAFTASPRGWRFLRSERDQLGPMLTHYDEWTRRLPNGDIDHPARLYLIDRAGRIREIYSLGLFDEQQAFLDIRALLREPR